MTISPRAKGPPNLPTVGERCRLRGKPYTGVVRVINPSNFWTNVTWDSIPGPGPKVVHLFELEVVK